MKINKLSYISLLVAGMMTVSSCSDILDTPPTTSPSEAIFWQSKSDFDSALAGCYEIMQAKTLSHGMIVFDCLTDNAYGSSGSSYVYQSYLIQADNLDPSMGGFVPDLYKEAYAAITRLNIFLYQLNNYQGGDMSSVRNQYEGEALFLRSYCYYLLYLCYGEVPYPTVPLDITTQNMPKETLDNVYKNLTSDLQTAIDKMDDKTFKGAGGHATKGAAKALKARVLMFHAYGDDGKIANRDEVQEAYNLLNEISGYSLAERYADNFTYDAQEGCPEIVFSIKFLAPNDYNNFDHIYGNYSPARPVENLIKEYEDGDNRLGQIVAFDDKYQWPGGEVVSLTRSDLKKAMIKWLTPMLKDGEMWQASTRSEQDWVFLRWGELLLLKAEAANELGIPGAAEMVNQIRKRAGLADLAANLTQDQLREKIRHERRVETPFELIRYYDMKRWKIMDKLNGLELDPLLTGHVTAWSKAHEYLPLPQDQVDFSNGVLIQNPNY
nr:RagB/SusD family nutrient uptake outer membrane protein [Parabacteroides goldsteinii]